MGLVRRTAQLDVARPRREDPKVRVYSSADQVRLLLNGKEIGVKPVSPETELRVEFEVPYASGELKAVRERTGRLWRSASFKTVGKPAGLRLRADRTALRRNRNDLSFVTVEVVDQAGNWCRTP